MTIIEITLEDIKSELLKKSQNLRQNALDKSLTIRQQRNLFDEADGYSKLLFDIKKFENELINKELLRT